METRTNVPAAAKLKLAFAYDYRGRRVEKRVYQWNGSAYESSPSSITRFLYDGWNMVAELDGMYESNHVLRSYLWGLDLSGSQRRAGGVGGLLAMTDHTVAPVKTYTYTYDGNGNVVDVVDQNGGVVAHYEYSPFGELITSTGTMATKNPFQFSTKYTDDETGLLYYGYRYYNPSTGRWINRDPIEEDGGLNLYGFVGNSPLNYIDPLGLWSLNFVGNNWDALSELQVELVFLQLEVKMPSILDRLDELEKKAEKICNGCAFKKPLQDDLKKIRKIVEGMQSKLQGNSKLNIKNTKLPEDTDAQMIFRQSVYDKLLDRNGRFTGNMEIDVTQALSIGTLFHELSHIEGTNRNHGPNNVDNAHYLETLVDDEFDLKGIKNEKIVQKGIEGCTNEDRKWPEN